MVDTLAKKLVIKMKNFAPDFAINTCFRSIKITNIYSYTHKPKSDILDTPNCVYHFQCECSENYIGQSKRKLNVRIGEHQQNSRKPLSANILKTAKLTNPNLNILKTQ